MQDNIPRQTVGYDLEETARMLDDDEMDEFRDYGIDPPRPPAARSELSSNSSLNRVDTRKRIRAPIMRISDRWRGRVNKVSYLLLKKAEIFVSFLMVPPR